MHLLVIRTYTDQDFKSTRGSVIPTNDEWDSGVQMHIEKPDLGL